VSFQSIVCNDILRSKIKPYNRSFKRKQHISKEIPEYRYAYRYKLCYIEVPFQFPGEYPQNKRIYG
jgi:hypothetical protein